MVGDATGIKPWCAKDVDVETCCYQCLTNQRQIVLSSAII